MNPQGEQTNKITYDAFGNTINGSIDEDMPFGYNGKIMDTETGQYNYGFRDYTPTAGRFSTVDPIKDGTSWYNYCGNDPVNFVDLWGLETLTIYNRDPTNNDDLADFGQGMDVGHTWMGIDLDDDGEDDKTFGWGTAHGSDRRNVASGNTVNGALLDSERENKGRHSNDEVESYSLPITENKANEIEQWWNDQVSSGTVYNYGGSQNDPNATMCTESVVNCLNDTNVLNGSESAIVNEPWDEWGNRYPDEIPDYAKKIADKLKNNTNPNPNEMAERIKQLHEGDNSNDCPRSTD